MSGTAARKSTTGRASAKPTAKGVSARTPARRPPVRRTTRAVQAKARAVRRRRIRVAATLGILLALGLAVLARGTWEVRTTRLNETHFVTDELTAELRVVQVTDFHNIPRTTQVRDIVELVRAAEPDLIAITGDLVNTHNRTLDPARRLLAGLAGIDAPRYFVDGNHDHWSADHAEVHRLLEAHGVTILDDEHTVVTGGFGTVSLIGVDDYFTGNGDLAAAVDGLPDDGFRLVLTHSPEILPELDAHGVDYAMCGHTHGGQIRLPFVGAIYQPGGQLFPRISKGAYTDGDATLYIDSGLGTTGPEFRLFNQSQVTLHRIGPQG